MILERNHHLTRRTARDEGIGGIGALRHIYRVAEITGGNAGLAAAIDGSDLSSFQEQYDRVIVMRGHRAGSTHR